jgi:nucleoid-associated protein YgaU
MMKNRAIWVALVVVAVAALLMFFVVLPLVRGDRTAQELAKKATETAEQAKDATQKTVDAAKQATGEAVADVKSGVLAKMARLKADTSAATGEMQALFAGGKTPTPAEIESAKTKVAAALKAASEFKAPEGVDAATSGMIAATQAGAAKALATVQAMPTDAEGAKKAFEGMKSTLLGALDSAATDKAATSETAATTDAKPADAEAADKGLPAFDILRVEPDGSTVIAGSAAPNSKLNVLDAGKVIASVDVGATGDFAAVLDNPLAAGDHQITLEAIGKDGKPLVSEEIATVSVPKDKSGELLAMVTKPGEASRILTMPEAKSGTEIAAATATENTATDAKDAAAKAQDSAVEAAKPVDTAKVPELPAASSDIAATAPAVDVAKTTEVLANSTDDAAKLAAKPKAATTAPEVQVSAVEIEGSKLFVAGGAKPNSVVRVYADDKLVAQVRADKTGRFVADNTLPLAVGNHTIRADVLSADGAKVEFRASVPFFRPEGEQLAAVAGDPAIDKAPMTPLADGAYDKAREETGKAIGLLKNLYKDGKTPSAEELAAARSSTEIALKSLAEIKLPVDADQTARDMASKTSTEAAKALALLQALPKDAGSVRQALGSIDAAVTSATSSSMQASASVEIKPAPEVAAGDTTKPADESVATSGETASSAASDTSQTAHAEVQASVDQPKVIEQAPLKASETSVIIRRGDTLWQISRRVYGKGVRYTTIYLANEKQITNPDRILPGQIFGVPDKPLPNAEELHRKRLHLK